MRVPGFTNQESRCENLVRTFKTILQLDQWQSWPEHLIKTFPSPCPVSKPNWEELPVTCLGLLSWLFKKEKKKSNALNRRISVPKKTPGLEWFLRTQVVLSSFSALRVWSTHHPSPVSCCRPRLHTRVQRQKMVCFFLLKNNELFHRCASVAWV